MLLKVILDINIVWIKVNNNNNVNNYVLLVWIKYIKIMNILVNKYRIFIVKFILMINN